MPIAPRTLVPSPLRAFKAREPVNASKGPAKTEPKAEPKAEKTAQEKYYEYRHKKEVAEDVVEILDLLILTGKGASKGSSRSPWGG